MGSAFKNSTDTFGNAVWFYFDDIVSEVDGAAISIIRYKDDPTSRCQTQSVGR
jgi:hypothetical protein